MRIGFRVKIFSEKFGFTLSEILVTLGVIGTISAITIPSIAYNYRAKVLEEQYRTTYSDIREIGSRLNYEKGDVGTYANKTPNLAVWENEFMSMINGGNNLLTGLTSDAGDQNITTNLRKIYQDGGGSPGPYSFNYGANGKTQVGLICNNGSIWTDSRGRLWTFNAESRIICVDINGMANPNQLNVDTFAFIPMDANQVATWVYDDPENPNDYSGAIIPCDLDLITSKGLSDNDINDCEKQGDFYVKNNNAPKCVLDACPFFEPIENIAAMHSTKPGKSARNKNVTAEDNYWKTYIDYK